MKNKLSGFTLIELMIVVAIIGILSAVALPSYIEHVDRSRRGIAQAELLSFSNAMEQYYIQNGSTYLDDSQTGNIPSVYPTTVKIDNVDMYDLSVTAITASTYTLSAAPITGTAQANDGTLTLTNTGARAWGTLTHW